MGKLFIFCSLFSVEVASYVYFFCSCQVLSTMEKHKDVFFVIKLQPHSAIKQNPINDPDPLIACDLMDGRDAFLTMAREKHWEFSTLRRCKFSTMAMLHEIHTSSRDAFVYTCNVCKGQVETRYHCTVCEVWAYLQILRLNEYPTLSVCMSAYL